MGTQLGIHAKPCGVLDIDGYFLPLRMMVDKMVDEGFLAEVIRLRSSSAARWRMCSPASSNLRCRKRNTDEGRRLLLARAKPLQRLAAIRDR
jgi:hypothetical protein